MTHEADIVPFPAAVDTTGTTDDTARLRDVIGTVLRNERIDQGRTLADVADEAAVSLPYLSEIERGRKEVSSDVLDAVIRSLDLDLAEVLERAADRLRRTRAVTTLDTRRLGGGQGRGPQAMLLAA